MLGVVLFGERLNHHPVALVGEILSAAVLVVSVIALSRSPLVQDGGAPVARGHEKRAYTRGPASMHARTGVSPLPDDDARF